MNKAQETGPIILFDGICNLCNHSVQFIIRNDTGDFFKFSSLQSDFAHEIFNRYELDQNNLDSIVLLYKNEIFTESTAALIIARHLKFPFRFLYYFIYVPAFIRNGVYRWIAKHRYNWFGKKDECWVPTEELKSKFLE